MVVSHFLVACLFLGSTTAAEWGYSKANGPSTWGTSSVKCDGTKQSPINLYEGNAEKKTIADFTYVNYDSTSGVEMKLINNGHSAKVSVEGNTKLSITGGGLTGTYQVAQFHFHWGSDSNKGSEHLISTHAFPMELHIVHYNTKYADITTAVPESDGLAVLGFMFEVSSSDNAAFAEIVKELANIQADGSEVSLTSFSMDSLLPVDKKNFFRYSGSLTTPSCDESVTWTVFKDTIKISETQLAAFRKILDKNNAPIVDNYRPVQPINAREIQVNYDIDLHWGYTTHVKADEWKNYYEACGGKQQSPIDIMPAQAHIDSFGEVALGDMTFTGYDSKAGVNMELQNNGHSAVLSWDAKSMKIDDGGLGEPYVAAQLHFHWGSDASMGSEHTMNKKAYPMEMHIVHYKESLGSVAAAMKVDKGLAVVGFFFEESSTDNTNYASLVTALPSVKDAKDKVAFTPVTLDSLIPTKRDNFYRYDGSLTTPGCYESVVWSVFGEKIPISAAQLQAFRDLMSAEKAEDTNAILPLVNNFRPVQPHNGRKVSVQVPKWDYDTKLGVTEWSKYYPICSDAEKNSKQSPINIDSTTVTLDPTMKPFQLINSTVDVDMNMENDGHTVKVSFVNADMLTRGGLLPHGSRKEDGFVPAQFHFHWGSDSNKGSEHFIDNKQYPMELHIVHYNNKYSFTDAVTRPDGLAVLGFMFEISETDNSALEPFVSKLADIKDAKKTVSIKGQNLASLLPVRMADYYRYQGSLTTPGCFESVTWTLFRDTIPISEAQMAKFRALKSSEKDTGTNTYKAMVNNYRPLQKRQGRAIYSNFLIGAGVPTSFSVMTLTLCSLYALIHRFL